LQHHIFPPWPQAEIAVMGAEAATAIIHRAEIQEAEDPAAKEQEKVAEYRGGRIGLSGFFVGEVMRASRGRANPVAAKEIVEEKLG